MFSSLSPDMSKYFHFSLQSAVSLWPSPPKLHLHLVRLHSAIISHFQHLFTFSYKQRTQRCVWMALISYSQQFYRGALFFTLCVLLFSYFPLQMTSGSSRWTSPTQVQFSPHWAAPFPSPAWYLCPPHPPLPLPPPLRHESSGLWCPVGWRRRSW